MSELPNQNSITPDYQVTTPTTLNPDQRQTERILKELTDPQDEHGNGSESPFDHRSSRRVFLKGAVGAAVTYSILEIIAAASEKPSDTGYLNAGPGEIVEFTKREGLPEDVLRDEELAHLGITIDQTADVQLYIRKAVVEELKLFQDIKKKKSEASTYHLLTKDVSTGHQ